MKKKKTIIFRIEEDIYKKIHAESLKQKMPKSEFLRNALHNILDTNNIKSESEVLKIAVSLIPDLQKQQEVFRSFLEKLETTLMSSEEAFQNVQSMKRGEGHHFKVIYETIKKQDETLRSLMTSLDTPTSKPESNAEKIMMNIEIEKKAQEMKQTPLTSSIEKPKIKSPFSV